jgi:hypothetical protein
LHRLRAGYLQARTARINALRGHLQRVRDHHPRRRGARGPTCPDRLGRGRGATVPAGGARRGCR